MKKRIWVAIAVIMTLALSATAALAAGPALTSTLSIGIIGDGENLTVENPLKVTAGAISVNTPKDGKIYPGEKIASVPLVITNVGRLPYQINISAQPVKTPDGSWPNFELRIVEGKKTYYPWQMPAIAPGTTMRASVEIYVSYGSALVSFQGLTLNIWPGQAEQTAKN